MSQMTPVLENNTDVLVVEDYEVERLLREIAPPMTTMPSETLDELRACAACEVSCNTACTSLCTAGCNTSCTMACTSVCQVSGCA